MTSAAEIIRRNGVTATDIAGIVGVSPWEGPWGVFARKMGRLPPREDNARMFWGRVLQEPIANAYAAKRNVELEWCDRPLTNPDRGWQIASPDAFIITPQKEILEVKTAGLDQAGEWGPTNGDENDVPEHIWAQVAWQMSVTGLKRAWVVVLIAGNDFRSYRIDHDRPLERALVEAGEDFWRKHLMTGIAPPIDGSEASHSWLGRRYPREREPLRLATADEMQKLDEYGLLRSQLKTAEKRRDELEAELKESIGDAAGLGYPGGRLTWKKANDGAETNWEQLAKDHLVGFSKEEQAAMIEQYTDVRPGARRLLWRPEAA